MIYKFERKLKGANQVEATGEELTINNAGRKVQKFELSGRSEQKARSGKNVINVRTTTISTYSSVGDDDYITVVRENTSETASSFCNFFTKITKELKTDTNYTILCEIKSIEYTGTGYLSITNDSTSFAFSGSTATNSFSGLKAGNIIINKLKTKSDFTNVTNLLRTFVAVNAQSSVKIVYRLSVIEGDVTADSFEYESYGVSPSPDFPSEIKNVGDDVNLAYISSKTDYNYSSTLEKDAVLINGTSTNAGNIVLYLNSDDGITLKANKKYIVRLFFDGDVTGNGYKTIYLQGMTIGDIASNKMVTKEIILSEDKVCKTINLDLSANCTFDNMKVKVMITENGKLKEYIPYNCIKATICNKNLYKVEKVINDTNHSKIIYKDENENVTFTTGGVPLIIAPTRIKEKTEYTYILKCKSNVTTENNINFTGIYEDGTSELLSANKKKDTNEFIVKFKTNKEKTLAYVTQQYTDSAGTTIITEGTMILEGDYLNLDEPYEIHQEQEIIFPLAEGQKLYEGSYLAEDGMHNKRKQITLNGTENWMTNESQQGKNTSYFYKTQSDMKMASNLISDKFIRRGTWGTDAEAISSVIDNYIRIRINTDRASTIDEFKKWLAENPVVVEYELAQEEIIPYTPEQQEIYSQLQNLELFRGCNHITVESNVKPTIKLSYYDGELDMTDYKYNLQFKKHMQEM